MLFFCYYYNKFIRFRQSRINYVSWVSYSYFSLRQHAFSAEPFPPVSYCQPVVCYSAAQYHVSLNFPAWVAASPT